MHPRLILIPQRVRPAIGQLAQLGGCVWHDTLATTPWPQGRAVARRVAVVESRPRALMRAHVCIGGTMRPLLVVCEATSAASPWAGMRSVLGRHAVLVGPGGLCWPCGGGARPQERVIGDSTIAVIFSHP